jgi:hypothetical protein
MTRLLKSWPKSFPQQVKHPQAGGKKSSELCLPAILDLEQE